MVAARVTRPSMPAAHRCLPPARLAWPAYDQTGAERSSASQVTCSRQPPKRPSDISVSIQHKVSAPLGLAGPLIARCWHHGHETPPDAARMSATPSDLGAGIGVCPGPPGGAGLAA